MWEVRVIRIVDFHAHVLPGIDDGAADLEESRKLLVSQKKQGIDTVVATPHFFKHSSIRRFVAKRDAALQLVQKEIKEEIPEVIPGAEVQFYCGLSERQRLRQLCIGDTDYILVEMPFSYWNDWYYDELDNLWSRQGVRPIIAHLDRYADTPEKIKNFRKLFDKDVLIQINSEALLHFFSRQVVKKFLRLDAFTVLGSDCHDSQVRTCTLKSACGVIKKKFGLDVLEQLMHNADAILHNQPVERHHID